MKRCYEKVPFYRKVLKNANISPQSLRTLDDISKLPFTKKSDMRRFYPFGLLATEMEDVVRVHASSGTTGNPVVVAYTKRDIKRWAELMARNLTSAGITRKDIFQNMIGYGLFTGGLGAHYGAELIGATVIPSGTGNTRRQIKIMVDFGVTAVHAIPSYMLYVSEVMEGMGIDPERDTKLRRGIFGAEPWSEGMRRKIEYIFGMDAYDNYGLSEMIGPGVGIECKYKEGLHIWSDHFLPEIVDPKTGERVEVEEKGELVLTTLTKEAMPVLRYRTGDITYFIDGECECGRTHPRIGRIKGRTDDMLIVRGVNIFPSQIEHVLMEMKGVGNSYEILIDRDVMDEITVKVEVSEERFDGEIEKLIDLKKEVEERLKEVIGIRANVKLVEPFSISRREGKAKRVIDRRGFK